MISAHAARWIISAHAARQHFKIGRRLSSRKQPRNRYDRSPINVSTCFQLREKQSVYLMNSCMYLWEGKLRSMERGESVGGAAGEGWL